ncbi:unnamed protein product [Leptosia nina]|uniref:Uncharacterized protein n=1 Tax=Leptosia nina TaxID=320188 RepID=A0AAV1JHK9_9NEOP
MPRAHVRMSGVREIEIVIALLRDRDGECEIRVVPRSKCVTDGVQDLHNLRGRFVEVHPASHRASGAGGQREARVGERCARAAAAPSASPSDLPPFAPPRGKIYTPDDTYVTNAM